MHESMCLRDFTLEVGQQGIGLVTVSITLGLRI